MNSEVRTGCSDEVYFVHIGDKMANLWPDDSRPHIEVCVRVPFVNDETDSLFVKMAAAMIESGMCDENEKATLAEWVASERSKYAQ